MRIPDPHVLGSLDSRVQTPSSPVANFNLIIEVIVRYSFRFCGASALARSAVLFFYVSFRLGRNHSISGVKLSILSQTRMLFFLLNRFYGVSFRNKQILQPIFVLLRNWSKWHLIPDCE